MATVGRPGRRGLRADGAPALAGGARPRRPALPVGRRDLVRRGAALAVPVAGRTRRLRRRVGDRHRHRDGDDRRRRRQLSADRAVFPLAASSRCPCRCGPRSRCSSCCWPATSGRPAPATCPSMVVARREPLRARGDGDAAGARPAPRASAPARRVYARRPDRPAQPRAVPRPPRARPSPAPRRTGTRASPCCSSTSTTSRSSTTASATRAGDELLRRSPARLRARLRPATPWPASAATSSSCCCEDLAGDDERGRASPSACSAAATSRSPWRRTSTCVSASIGIAVADAPDATAGGAAARRRRRDVPGQGSAAAAGVESSTPSMRARRDRAAATRDATLRRALDARRARARLPADRRPARRATSSASRRCCAGSTPSAACCRPASSSPWPRRPGLIVPIGGLRPARGACRRRRAGSATPTGRALRLSVNVSAAPARARRDLARPSRAALDDARRSTPARCASRSPRRC